MKPQTIKALAPASIDISQPDALAQSITLANALQTQIEAFWKAVRQQMEDRSITTISGLYGSVAFENVTTLTITDVAKLDPILYDVKPTLNTKAVHSYQQLYQELPAGVGSTTAQRFAKHLKK